MEHSPQIQDKDLVAIDLSRCFRIFVTQPLMVFWTTGVNMKHTTQTESHNQLKSESLSVTLSLSVTQSESKSKKSSSRVRLNPAPVEEMCQIGFDSTLDVLRNS